MGFNLKAFHKKTESKPTGSLRSGVNGLGLEMLNFFLVKNHSAPICAAGSCLNSIFGFVLQICKKDGEQYLPNTLYQIIYGLQCNCRETGRADVNLFMNPALHDFCCTLDGEMKYLNATDNYVQGSRQKFTSKWCIKQ